MFGPRARVAHIAAERPRAGWGGQGMRNRGILDKCRIGLVGAGNVAQRHARVLSGFDDVTLVGVTDVAAPAAAALADRYGAATCDDVAAVLAAGARRGVRVRAAVRARRGRGGGPRRRRCPLRGEAPRRGRADRRPHRRPGRRGRGGHRRRPPLALPGDRRDGRASCWPDGRIRLVNGVWLDKVPPVAWWTRRDRSGGPVVEQAAHVVDLARAPGRRGHRGVRGRQRAPRRPSRAPTSTAPPRPPCGSRPAPSAR